jgi:hypothetical protein
MKNIKTLAVATITAILFTSCASFQHYAELILVSPQQTQLDITAIAARAKPYIPAESQAKIHNFAIQLSTTSNLDLTALYALLPASTGSVTGDLLVANAKAVVSLIVQRWGSNNATTLAYAKAVANGLLANFTVAENSRRQAYIAIAKKFNDRSRLVTTASTTSTKPWEPNRSFYVEKNY